MKIKNKVLISVDESDLKDGHFYNSEITEIGDNCFCNMDSLIAVHVPNVKKIGSYCFRNNPAMTTTGDFGALTSMGSYCFLNNAAMTAIGDFGALTSMGSYCFYNNPAMTATGDFGALTSMGSECFSYNPAMTSLTIRGNTYSVRDVDGSCFVIESEKTEKGVKLYSGFNLLGMDKKKLQKQKCFVATKGAFSAHGETEAQAIEDLHFKRINDIAQGIRDMWRIKPEDIGKIQASVQYHFDKLPVPQKRIARKYMQKEMEAQKDTAITSKSLADDLKIEILKEAMEKFSIEELEKRLQ